VYGVNIEKPNIVYLNDNHGNAMQPMPKHVLRCKLNQIDWHMKAFRYLHHLACLLLKRLNLQILSCQQLPHLTRQFDKIPKVF